MIPISEGQETRERELLATRCDIVSRNVNLPVRHQKWMLAAAAELRKTCGTCKRFSTGSVNAITTGICAARVGTWPSQPKAWSLVPADGSGFCHRWEPRPASEATPEGAP